MQTIEFEESSLMTGATGYIIATSVFSDVHAELQVDAHGTCLKRFCVYMKSNERCDNPKDLNGKRKRS